MGIAEIIGYIAATVGAMIFLPQVIQTIKTKDTKSLSLPTFLMISVSNFLWLTLDSAIILSQVFILPMCLIILIYKLKFG